MQIDSFLSAVAPPFEPIQVDYNAILIARFFVVAMVANIFRFLYVFNVFTHDRKWYFYFTSVITFIPYGIFGIIYWQENLIFVMAVILLKCWTEIGWQFTFRKFS